MRVSDLPGVTIGLEEEFPAKVQYGRMVGDNECS